MAILWDIEKSAAIFKIFQGTTDTASWISSAMNYKNVYKTEMHAKPVQGNIVANKTNIILLLPSAWIRTCQCFSVCRRLSWKFILLMSFKQTGIGNHDTSHPNALKFLMNFLWKLILMWNISEHCWFIYPCDFSWIKMFFLTHLIYSRHWYFVHYLNVQNLYY